MSSIDVQTTFDEAERLDDCVLEPIHTPGAIQPHRALVTVEPETFTILQASSNCGDILGIATFSPGRPG